GWMPMGEGCGGVMERGAGGVWQWGGRRQRRGAPRSSSQSMMAPGSSEASEPRRVVGVSEVGAGTRRPAAGGVAGAGALSPSDGAGDFTASGGVGGATVLVDSAGRAGGGNLDVSDGVVGAGALSASAGVAGGGNLDVSDGVVGAGALSASAGVAGGGNFTASGAAAGAGATA